MTAWAGFLQQTSEDASDTDAEVDSKGVSYGIQAKYVGLSLTASGFDASGVGLLLGPGVDNTLAGTDGWLLDADGDEVDSDGYLLQASFATGAAAGRGVLDWLAEQRVN